jgi:hypothetical protein
VGESDITLHREQRLRGSKIAMGYKINTPLDEGGSHRLGKHEGRYARIRVKTGVVEFVHTRHETADEPDSGCSIGFRPEQFSQSEQLARRAWYVHSLSGRELRKFLV